MRPPLDGPLGILGGGQLGRMLALAAARLGIDCVIFSDEADAPACRAAASAIIAPYEDEAALQAFAGKVRLATYEFENIPVAAAERLQALGVRISPGPQALAVSQDRLLEKRFLNELGAATAPFAAVDDAASLAAAAAHVGLPAILKTRRLGYDGKGQIKLQTAADLPGALAAIGHAPAILEGLARFVREVSIVAARGADGAMAFYDLCENTHVAGVLARSLAPAPQSEALTVAARRIAQALAERLDYVGVFAIEFFAMPDGALWANEWAPRVHNSGHWTADACLTGQFEQHVRAVCGWPLGDPARLAQAEMHNLLGEEVMRWPELAAQPDVRVWLYGKAQARPGRKMGHWTRLTRGSGS